MRCFLENEASSRHETRPVSEKFAVFNFILIYFYFIRRRHVVEMLEMAQRPYSSVILDTTAEKHPESQTQKTVGKMKPTLNKKDLNIIPVAVETTANGIAAVSTVFIRLPGEKRIAVCLGSSLIIQPKNNFFLNKPPPRISQQMV